VTSTYLSWSAERVGALNVAMTAASERGRFLGLGDIETAARWLTLYADALNLAAEPMERSLPLSPRMLEEVLRIAHRGLRADCGTEASARRVVAEMRDELEARRRLPTPRATQNGGVAQ